MELDPGGILPFGTPAPGFRAAARRTGPGTDRRKRRGQDRCRSWPSRARGINAPGPVSRPCQSVRLSDRRYATDRDLTREMPLVVPRDQRYHFLPPVMTTVFPSGCGGRGFRLQPRHLEYRLYEMTIVVNPRRNPRVPSLSLRAERGNLVAARILAAPTGLPRRFAPRNDRFAKTGYARAGRNSITRFRYPTGRSARDYV